MTIWTIQKLLNWTTEYLTNKGVDSPRLSAELLISNVTGLKRIELYTQFDRQVPKHQLDNLHELVKRSDRIVAFSGGSMSRVVQASETSADELGHLVGGE